MGPDKIIKLIDHRSAPAIVLLLYSALYLLFPSGLSTTDAWNYAAEIRHSGDLFYPYHLLYNLLGYIFTYLPSGAGADVLGLLKIMNSIFAVASLYLVQLIVRQMGMERLTVIAVSSAAGASFSIMRYGTENETYIVPLFIGLAAAFCFICFLKSGKVKYAVFSGLLSSIAVLFHVTYICWWAGLLAGLTMKRHIRALLYFLLCSMMVPLVYLAIIFLRSGNIGFQTVTGFLLEDFLNNSGFALFQKGIMLWFMNIVRSFVQVHGYMLNMLKSNLLFIIPLLLSSALFVLSLFHLPSLKRREHDFSAVLIIIAVLNMILALLSGGNAEFMVMIPVIFFMLIPLVFINAERFILIVFAGMLIWNISYGLLPGSLENLKAEQFLAAKSSGNNNVLVIPSDDQLIISMVYYDTGIRKPGSVLKPPAIMKINGEDPASLGKVIDKALTDGKEIYTNCIGSSTISRASIILGDINNDFFRNYVTSPVVTEKRITGTKTVYRITGKRDRVD